MQEVLPGIWDMGMGYGVAWRPLARLWMELALSKPRIVPADALHSEAHWKKLLPTGALFP